MTRRSRAREVALQLLFQRDFNPAVPRQTLVQFATDRLRESELRVFCMGLFDGVASHLEEIDVRLAASAENWRVSRMATVDRNVLRLGTFELLFTNETPDAVAFDEAIELARRFGSADSPSFVNGVLDRLRREASGAEAAEAAVPTESADATAAPSPESESTSPAPPEPNKE